MKITEYLAAAGMKRKHFASLIGVSQGYVTMICKGKLWPSHDVMVRIMRETGGAVMPNDFIKPDPGDRWHK